MSVEYKMEEPPCLTDDDFRGILKRIKDPHYTEEQYRAIMKRNQKLSNNAPPGCVNKRSYELIILREASDTKKRFLNVKYVEK